MEAGIPLVAPKFTLAERNRRWAAVRTAMQRRGLAALIFPHATGDWDNLQPDLRYMSCIGGGGMAAALVFPLAGEPIAAVREGRRIGWWRAAQDWIADVRSPPQFRWSAFFAEALAERGLSSERIGIVGLGGVLREPEGIMAQGEFVALCAALPHARFEPATDILYAIRKRKSAEEIGMVEKAQRSADAISAALRETARPGVAEHEIFAAMVAADIRHGGETPSMLLLGTGPTMWQTQMQPSFRALAPDDVIIIEAEPKFFGYMAQAVDTVSLRPFTRTERTLLEASQDCFEALLAAMRPGESYRRLIEIWGEHARKAGCRIGRTMGHGLGLGQDMPLTTPAGAAPDRDLPVEEGDCFVLKPWFANDDDTVSARVGGTIVVGGHGARKLGKAELRAMVVG